MSISKEEFKFNDRLIKGIETKGRFKISVVKTTDVVQTAKDNHGLSLLNTVLLGRTLTAAMLLASELKGEERIKVQMEGNGPVGFLIAEANRVGEIRGYSQNPTVELDYSQPDVSIGDGIGLGLLTVSKTLYNEAEPRTSTIEIVEGDVLSDMAHYMVQSEQVLSAFLLDVSLKDNGDVNQAGGLLIQRLPEADESVMKTLQTTVKELSPVSNFLEDGHYIDAIMEEACKPFPVKELDRQPVHFFCRCSTDKFKNALSLLSYEDLKELKGEDQEMVCHYCGSKHTVSEEEIYSIVESAKAKLN
ncbi:Hsp33 family molecular chaperone HslO [Rhodohalobacter sulfatireducens]|uniref:Hsp33 family molecular chaperone HslO n=1 Tax=Rhodohalobacter sulfatireducens TaxID=2911366 RepID=A0ABS9K833_9BACT|nr:Hsp33 family molecular chaperone HslO [Rhodohalobacter sulfatireducens]MCG2587012.1 Hsp33 family molecular chaperone HslO [Rhodohalobacter sulfatireducens]